MHNPAISVFSVYLTHNPAVFTYFFLMRRSSWLWCVVLPDPRPDGLRLGRRHVSAAVSGAAGQPQEQRESRAAGGDPDAATAARAERRRVPVRGAGPENSVRCLRVVVSSRHSR